MKVRFSAVGAVSGNLDDFKESGLVNGERVGFPCRNARLAQVDDSDLDVRVLLCDNGTCRAAL